MSIQVGEKLPHVTLRLITADGPKPVTTQDFFGGRKVVLFGLPGAFTPTCHKNHLPGFLADEAAFKAKVEQVGQTNFTQFERMVLLQSIDTHWRDHLSALDYLRQGIHLRGYAQKQPKQEYKREAFELFGQLLDSVKNDVTKVLMTVRIQSQEQIDQAAHAMEARADAISNVTYSAPTETGEVETTVDAQTIGLAKSATATAAAAATSAMARVGRNDACPCGSGKKYKHCHGQLA